MTPRPARILTAVVIVVAVVRALRGRRVHPVAEPTSTAKAEAGDGIDYDSDFFTYGW